MKTIYIILVLCCFFAVSALDAQVVRTFSNRPGETGEFSNLQEVINASSDGDIIYVSGSPTNYGNITIGKRLILVGTGHNPDNIDGLVSQLTVVSLVAGSSSTEIIGFSISSVGISGSTTQVDKVILRRNFIISSVGLNFVSREWIIEENVLNSISSPAGIAVEENQIIRNNIIRGSILNVKQSFISNNVFTSTAATGFIQGSELNSFTNNIFFQNNLENSFSNGNIQNCTFNSNIFFGPNNPTSLPPTNGNTGEENIFSNPLFVNVPNNNFSYDQDFSLQASSPGINSGTDETDIGVFGGIGYSVTGEPAIPQVTFFNIVNSIVPQNGNLNIRIEGRANN